jgi:hypothetical protein
MKNNEKENSPEASLPVTVTATFDAIPFLEGLVKYLAERRYHVSQKLEITHPGWQAIDTATVETFVGGTLVLSDKQGKPMRISFASCFVFTCTRKSEGSYNLGWSNSLS